MIFKFLVKYKKNPFIQKKESLDEGTCVAIYLSGIKIVQKRVKI